MRTRDMSQRRRGLVWVGSIVGVAALAGSGVAIGQAISGPTDPGQKPIAQAQVVDATVASHIGAFRRPRRASDSLPAWAAEVMAARLGPVAGANPALSRSVQLGAAGTMYLVPANGQVCAISAGFGGCGPIAALTSEDLNGMNHLGTDPPHTARFTGIVPDNVTAVAFGFATGPGVRATLADNAYAVILNRPPTSITYATATDTDTRALDQAAVQTLLDGPAALANFSPK